jgi:hypothetical protein
MSLCSPRCGSTTDGLHDQSNQIKRAKYYSIYTTESSARAHNRKIVRRTPLRAKTTVLTSESRDDFAQDNEISRDEGSGRNDGSSNSDKRRLIAELLVYKKAYCIRYGSKECGRCDDQYLDVEREK